MLAIRLDVKRVVPVVGPTRRQTHRHEGEARQPELLGLVEHTGGAGCREYQHVLGPLLWARGSDQGVHRVHASGQADAGATLSRGSRTQTGWSANASSSRSPPESPYAHSSTSPRARSVCPSHCSSRRTFSAPRQLAPSSRPVHTPAASTSSRVATTPATASESATTRTYGSYEADTITTVWPAPRCHPSRAT